MPIGSRWGLGYKIPIPADCPILTIVTISKLSSKEFPAYSGCNYYITVIKAYKFRIFFLEMVDFLNLYKYKIQFVELLLFLNKSYNIYY